MKKWSRLTALLLAAVTTLGLTGAASAADSTGYTDVPAWAEEYVERMTEEKLIDGKTETTFGANDPMTRADLVVALYRLAGSPANAANEVNPFQDVADGAAYRDAVVWAYANKIIHGKSANSFDPESSVTRQEIAKIVNEFAARQVGKDELVSREDELSAFPDAAAVADWANSYMNWAVASEFIIGGDGKLQPTGTATRAQVSVILCRYMDDASTGDASKDNPRNQDGIGKNELLVVSFGTSYNGSRVATIGAIENALEDAFPDYSVRRGFTSNIIIEHVYRRDGEAIDDVAEALERAKANGVEDLLVQPTHLMNGYEYGDLVKELEKYAGDFNSIKIGAPLLTTDDDFAVVADAMVKATAEFDDGETAICFMGHGTEAASNGIYAKMQEFFNDAGYDNYFVGTVESEPTAEELVELVQQAGYTKVVLRPMMIVAGDHANNDMADENDPESWYSVFSAAGFDVRCEIKGLGELTEVQDLLVAHARDAKELDKTGIEVEPNPGNTQGKLADGVYTIDVSSNSSMFRVVACELTVKDGEMTAVLTLSGKGYSKMYVGTAAEAEKAGDGLIDYVEDSEGAYTFTVPVETLDEELSYAALGTKWYDRGLTFESATAVAK